MSDIAKCEDKLCPSKKYCYRYTAPANKYRQSYLQMNRQFNAKDCDMFWQNDVCRCCGLKKGNHKISCETRKEIL